MNVEAILKIRKKFTLIAMASVAAVMLIIIIIINMSNYNGVMLQLRSILNYLCEHEGDLPAGIEPEDLDDAEAVFTEEFRFTTRYFAVVFGKDSRTSVIKTGHIAAIDQEEALSYAEEVLENGDTYGSKGVYFYKMQAYHDGRHIVVFLDGTTQLRSLRRLIRASIMIFCGGIFIVFWPVWFFSGKVIEPELESINRQKQFITNASHELKTPLAVIRANTELEEIMSGETEWTASTLKQVSRLEGLIASLVTLARASERVDERVVQETDISPVVREAAEEFRSVAENQGKKLYCHVQEPLILKSDVDRLKQLVGILVDNAIKYCDDGGAITVGLKMRGRAVLLTVSNDFAEGKGQDFSHFFERFYRNDSSHNTEKGGYGIGLSIAYDIVKASRGRIDVGWKSGVITFTCHFNG